MHVCNCDFAVFRAFNLRFIAPLVKGRKTRKKTLLHLVERAAIISQKEITFNSLCVLD